MDKVLGKSWAQGIWCGFDTETTGLSAKRDRIATATVIIRDVTAGAEADQIHNWVINPGVSMPPAAAAVNGLTDEFLRATGAEPAVALEEIVTQLVLAMSGGMPLVGYNVSYDLAMLEANLQRNGLATLRERLGGRIFPVVDPLVLDRILDRYRKGKRNLATSCEFYGVPPRDDFHNAQADVTATLDLLVMVVAKYPELTELSLEDLFRFQQEGHRVWAENFNQYMAAKGRTFYPNQLGWPLDQDKEAALNGEK